MAFSPDVVNWYMSDGNVDVKKQRQDPENDDKKHNGANCHKDLAIHGDQTDEVQTDPDDEEYDYQCD